MAADVEDNEVEFREELTDSAWEIDPSPSLTARFFSEIAGTFILVLLGVGTAMFGVQLGNGTLAVGLAFGFAVTLAIVVFGATSGAHLNPAITVGLWLAGRFPARDIAPYILAQVIGAVAASGANCA